jgi:hypothetical protein
MRRINVLHTLALAPLLMGAGAGQINSALTVDKLPSCAANEYLTYRSGGLACTTIMGGNRVQWPDCTNQLLTVSKSGDVSSLKCTTKGVTGAATNTTLLKSVEDRTVTLGTTITQIEANPPKAGLGSFKGLSAKTYTGHIKLRGEGDVGVQDNGLLAASKICEKDQGAGAHICPVDELFNSAINGKLVRTAPMAETAWVYSHTFANPLNARVAGLSDNCAALSYETADAAWQGTAFQWRTADTPVNGKGDFAPNFYLVGCNTSRKIACCQ